MSDFATPPPADDDRDVTDHLDAPDPDAPADADAVRARQEENAGTSLDQPS